MEPILYWYPVSYLNGEEPYGSVVVRKSGRIIPLQLKKEPYEVDVEAGGASFHLIFGHKTNGMFLCVPDRNIGCELSELLNRGMKIQLPSPGLFTVLVACFGLSTDTAGASAPA